MIVWRASLNCTAYKIQQFPAGVRPEVALAGRSNVGKSSLLNRLAGRKLARVSAEPASIFLTFRHLIPLRSSICLDLATHPAARTNAKAGPR